MVRNAPGCFSRDNYSPRDQWTNVDRFLNDSPINPNHFSALSSARSSEASTIQAPAIETALRERCGINVKEFAMIATLEDGHTATFTSEKLVAQEKYLFNQEFRAAYFRYTGYGGYPAQGYNDSSNTNNSMRRQSSSTDSSSGQRRNRTRLRQDLIKEDSDDDDDDDEGIIQKGRKRLRGAQDDDDDKAAVMAHSTRTRELRIADTEEVTKFFEGRFRDLQQAACKIIAKAFVKVVEPRKQTNFPYTGGADRAPLWWPPMPVEGQTGGVKHKEPDHLLKPERIILLVHILRIQHVSEYGKEHVNIKALQDKTKEAMLTWFNDKPENKAKSKYLDEIFKVARAEERYRRGEIDGTYVVPVMHGTDQGAPESFSDDEADDTGNDEEEDAFSTMTPQSQQIYTPDSSMVSPTSNHSHSSLTRPMSGTSTTGFPNHHRDMPHRQFSNIPTSNHLPRPEDPTTYENEPLAMNVQSFIPSRPMSYIPQHQQNHGLPDQARRPPTCHPSQNFPTNSSNVFTNWSNSNTMIPSNPISYNSYPPQTTTPLASNGPHLPLPNSTSLLPPMHSHNLNTQQHNQQHNTYNDSAMAYRDHSQGQHLVGAGNHSSLRTGSLGNPHQYHTQQNAYGMNEWHDYTHQDAVMKDENLGSGGS